jgi:D-sedoheptulose 7-phosphate isomerase
MHSATQYMSDSARFASISSYATQLADVLRGFDWATVENLASDLLQVWKNRSAVWICGNGGSAANAVHWANDFLYPVAKRASHGIRIHALNANPSVLTCLGNDLGYNEIFAYQLRTLAAPGDMLIVLSGSGNSANILKALNTARALGVKSYAILGFDGGAAKALADLSIHFEVDNMQIAEDVQMVICHALVQTLVDVSDRPTA